jgi:hypothetical protein
LKFWPKGENGRASGWNKSCKKQPPAQAGLFPLSGGKLWHQREELMHLRTGVGVVELKVWRGQDSEDGHWGCPIRERWGLRAHQQMSPVLEDRLAFTVTATGSYEEAALLAERWGCAVSASAIHALVQRLGQKAEEQTQARLQEVPQESQPQRGPTPLAVLMLDGWQARFRGLGWGEEKPQAERVEWHEIKTGVFYRQEQAAQTPGGRGVNFPEGISTLARGGAGVGAAFALGSPAGGSGAGARQPAAGRWDSLDLESGRRPLAGSRTASGLLSWGPAYVEPGASLLR